jgi:hypothetical protein
MKPSRRRINSVFLALTLASVAAPADQLVRFDDPSIFVALRSDGNITGYYVGHSNESYLSPPGQVVAVCEFVFIGQTDRDGNYKLKAWETGLIPAPETKVAKGAIYVDSNEWIIQFDEVPNGCRSKKDGERFLWEYGNYFIERNIPVLSKEEQGMRIRTSNKSKIVGVRVVQSGAAPVFQVRASSTNAKSSFVITRGGLVTAIRQEKDCTYVEYIVPNTGEKLSGWVQTKHLKDPFTK